MNPAVAFNVTELPEQIVVEPTGVMLNGKGVPTVIVVTVDVEGQLFEPVAVTL